VTSFYAERVHADLLERGWAFSSSAEVLGLPPAREMISALSPALEPDPRGPGKLHARDVIDYDRMTSLPCVEESDSIAHVDGTDDYSRFHLLDALPSEGIAETVLELVPPPLRRDMGRLSADYFRYSPGTDSAAHQDGFGDLVVIWVLDRDGDGAESFLTTLDGHDVMRAPVPAGGVLIFRDEMFLHGVTPLKSGHRDALIFITLKDGA
jgi:hypothetical protein